jgi:hypothetical protein
MSLFVPVPTITIVVPFQATPFAVVIRVFAAVNTDQFLPSVDLNTEFVPLPVAIHCVPVQAMFDADVVNSDDPVVAPVQLIPSLL